MFSFLSTVASAEDSPLAMKIKKTWLRTPVGEEQAAQAVLDPSIGNFLNSLQYTHNLKFRIIVMSFSFLR